MNDIDPEAQKTRVGRTKAGFRSLPRTSPARARKGRGRAPGPALLQVRASHPASYKAIRPSRDIDPDDPEKSVSSVPEAAAQPTTLDSDTTPSRPDLDELRAALLDRMSPSIAELDPVPAGVVEQARRFAMLRAELMRSGAFDLEALAAGWDTSEAATRKRVARAVERREIFTVTYRDRLFVPALCLHDDLQIRADLQPLIAPLMDAGDGGFSLWSWLVTPSAWLDGAIPIEQLVIDPDAAMHAARRRASNAA